MPEPPPHNLPYPDRLPVGLLCLQLDGTLLAVNRLLCEWLGHTPEQLVGGPVDQVFASGGAVLYHTYLLPLLRLHGRVQELALRLRHAGGGGSDALVYGTIEAEADPPRIHLVLVPMRERRRIEGELLRVQRAADAAPVVLFEYLLEAGRGGRFSYLSAGAETLLGVPAAELQAGDAPWIERLHPEDRAPLVEARDAASRAPAQWRARFRLQAHDAAPWAWHEVLATPRRLADGTVLWHGAFSDVTLQHEAEQAERARVAAEQASRAKSEFLARMSHELRTPLNGIIGFAQLLAGEPELREAHRRRLGIIESSGYRLLDLINEVLDITRIESGQLHLALQPVALKPLVTRALQIVEPMAHALALRLGATLDESLWVRADPARLEQVLVNLVSNAVKYNRPRGEVEVTAQAHQGWVTVAVRDTGIGLDQAQQRRLFQPFDRLGAERTRTEGTGLGLVIVGHLTQAMGGTIGVNSTAGVGSCFEVRLPQAIVPASAPAGVSVALEALSRRSRRVLYVEDDAVNAILVAALLEGEEGVELHLAADGATAVREAAQCSPDLLLLDIHLPDIDGIELLRRLRAQPGLARVPAVAVSADSVSHSPAQLEAAGFAACWIKPLDIGQARTDLRRLLALDGVDPRLAA